MPEITTEDDIPLILRYGGGVNSRASEQDIEDIESAAGGKNYEIDPANLALRPRKPFDLLHTAPNGSEIRGFVNLVKTDGTSQILVQAGNTVYEYDPSSGFTASPVWSVNANARLRGRIEHNWGLTDKVLITDLELHEDVMEWDGTTLQDVTFSPSGTDLRAKYCIVEDERAIFANVYNNGSSFPHLLIASEISDYTTISVSDRPSSSLGTGDAFFLVSPDLRGFNGLVSAWGEIVFSTKDGTVYYLTGNDSTDFSINPIFARALPSGDETLTFIGNDVIYGKRGRIESLKDTDKLGETEADDLSLKIGDLIETYKDWTIVYNNRTQKAYCFPDGQSECWVFHKPVKDVGSGVSPWVKYDTKHDMAFQPTTVMNMIDPNNGLEYVFMGDSSGNVYRMEGTGTSGDAGSEQIETVHISKLVSMTKNEEMSNYNGYVRYRKNQAFNLEIVFQYAGQTAQNETRNITIEAAGGSYYGQALYYGGSVYYGQEFGGRLVQKKITQPGQGENFQIKTRVEGTKTFEVMEAGFRFYADNQ